MTNITAELLNNMYTNEMYFTTVVAIFHFIYGMPIHAIYTSFNEIEERFLKKILIILLFSLFLCTVHILVYC